MFIMGLYELNSGSRQAIRYKPRKSIRTEIRMLRKRLKNKHEIRVAVVPRRKKEEASKNIEDKAKDNGDRNK